MLGEGSFGEVFQGELRFTDVVIKVMRARKLGKVIPSMMTEFDGAWDHA